MSENTRKDAAAEIRKLREENALLAIRNSNLTNSIQTKIIQINTSEFKVAYYKKLLDESIALCANVIKEATKAVGVAEKYRAKMKFWRLSFFAVLAGVILFCVTSPFLNY